MGRNKGGYAPACQVETYAHTYSHLLPGAYIIVSSVFLTNFSLHCTVQHPLHLCPPHIKPYPSTTPISRPRQTHSIMPATSYPPPPGHYHYIPQPYINLPATSPETRSSFPCRQATMDTYPTYPYPPPSTIQSSYSISTLPSYPSTLPECRAKLSANRLFGIEVVGGKTPTAPVTVTLADSGSHKGSTCCGVKSRGVTT